MPADRVSDGPASSELVDVPYESLSEDALRGVIEEFVTRSGTDYGSREKTLEEKAADVHRQLERGEAKIVFDGETGLVNIVARSAT